MAKARPKAKKEPLSKGSCFEIARDLTAASFALDLAWGDARFTKRSKKFAGMIDDVKRSLIHASYFRTGISRRARALARRAAALDFTFQNALVPKEKKIRHVIDETLAIGRGVNELYNEVQTQCGARPMEAAWMCAREDAGEMDVAAQIAYGKSKKLS